MPKARVLLIDDHPLLRQGLAQLINQEDDLELCGEAADGASAHSAIAQLAPDIAIVDLTLKDESGTDLIRQLSHDYPALKLMVFSVHDEWLHAERALAAGARGYVMKHEPSAQVLAAIRQVLQGEIYLSQRMSARLLNRLVGNGQDDALPISALSNREMQIFTMIGKGNSSRQVADTLCVSIKTVETHRERIKEKLKLRNATELLRLAMSYTQNL